MTALWGLLGQLLGAIVGPVARAWEKWFDKRTARDLGRQEQRAADLQSTVERTNAANQARAGVAGAADDDLDNKLRAPGARPRR